MSDPQQNLDQQNTVTVIVQPLSPGIIHRGPLTEDEKAVRDRLFGRRVATGLLAVALPLIMAIPTSAQQFCHRRDGACFGPCPQGTRPVMTMGGCYCR